jgi:hypothetical protein
VELLPIAVLAVAVAAVWVGLSRANELFVVEVSEGRARGVRGRIPPRLLADLDDVVRRPAVARGELRVVSDGGRPYLARATGLAPEQVQRARNVIGLWTVSQIRTARPVRG